MIRCVTAQGIRFVHLCLLPSGFLVATPCSFPLLQLLSNCAGVLDKGTLDALICGDMAERDSLLMMREVARVLEGGGVYFMVTSQAPVGRFRLMSFCFSLFNWRKSEPDTHLSMLYLRYLGVGDPGCDWENVHVYEVSLNDIIRLFNGDHQAMWL